MAWHSILLNFLLAELVVVAICGSLLWAIATQHQDWPQHARVEAWAAGNDGSGTGTSSEGPAPGLDR
jgi:hypothetical protein